MVRHRLVLTGGGTGGHIYPALAMAEQFREDAELESILYIGARGHLEEKLAKARSLDFIGLEVSGMPRKLSGKLLSWPFQLSAAVVEVRRALLDFRPTVILGTGGYASAPALMAAAMLDVPFAIHEPDAHPGLVNRLLSRKASLVSCGMHGAYDTLKPKKGKIVVNGNPVAKSFLNPLKRDAACAVLGLRSDLKTVLITGGSQGAKAINDAIISILPDLLAVDPPVQIIHQVGEKNIYECKERIEPAILNNSRYFLRDYFDDLSVPYAVADITICRAGAMTISELSVMGTPAIFIPYPYAAADHQTHNAKYMASKGSALVFPQSPSLPELLRVELLRLLADEEKLKNMHRTMLAEGKPRAATDLASQLKEISTAHQIKQSKENVETHS
jgi:UDP-N-acetylglucosamine--N-acetylmuramyl-(pentapeptide) pyrophosphoryl-undecaprenol N-acetylglucosamine transferase